LLHSRILSVVLLVGAQLLAFQPPPPGLPPGPPKGRPSGSRHGKPPGPPREPVVYGEPDKDYSEAVAAGITLRQHGFKRDGLPFTLQVLEVDPANPAVNILPVHALDRATGKETTSSMARRYGATAAVNGGYFFVHDPLEGGSTGVYQLNGRVLSSGDSRTALLFCKETADREQTAIATAVFHGTVTAGNGASHALAALNQIGKRGDLVAYAAGPQSPAAMKRALEVTLDADGRVGSVKKVKGGTTIPAGGTVLSATGASAQWLRKNARPGATLHVELNLEPEGASAKACQPMDIIGAGPRLITDGKINVTEEGFDHSVTRHPRTSFAVTREGHFLFVTLAGRQSASAGMTLEELAAELLSMGAVEAFNLDGGGSTTLVVNDKLRNTPSDKDNEERAVSDAILIYSIADLDALSTLVDKLTGAQIEAAPAARLREGIATARHSKAEFAALAKLVSESEGHGISTPAARLLSEAIRALAR
jgi:exopolysaccharide biosynthesis protein